MTGSEVVIAILGGLLVNEFSDVCPWMARRIARWAAYRYYADRSRADIRAEEWQAVINDRPGKLFKLFTAVSLAIVGLSAATRRRARRPVGLFSGWGTTVLAAVVFVPSLVILYWVLMVVAQVALTELYTLPIVAGFLLVGWLAKRRRPSLSSWTVYGPGLVMAFLPTVVIIITTTTSGIRELLALIVAVATLVLGAVRRYQAPFVIGLLATISITMHAVATIEPQLLFVPGAGIALLGLSSERRRRQVRRLRQAIQRMDDGRET